VALFNPGCELDVIITPTQCIESADIRMYRGRPGIDRHAEHNDNKRTTIDRHFENLDNKRTKTDRNRNASACISEAAMRS
jgi:hypothetical protein